MPPPAFHFGQFFGAFDRRRLVPGFEVADIRPAVPDRAVPRHTHDTAHFVFVLDGAYVTTATGTPGTSVGPTLIYNPPGTTHRDRFRSRNGRFLALSVAADSLALALEQYRMLERPTVLASPAARALATRLAGDDVYGGARPHARSEVPAAPGLLVESLCWELLAGAQPRGELLRTTPEWLLAARDLLRDMAAKPVRMNELAGTLGVHPIHLTRAFRRFFRCTPGDYLRRCRLERAAALLRDSRLEIAQIARAAGFADQSHLTRRFTRAYGLPPATYRRAHGTAPRPRPSDGR
jgi:AraC family transcriptional regulator